MNCPICRESIIKHGDLGEDGEVVCPRGCYDYVHSYGAHSATYGVLNKDLHDGPAKMVLSWSYRESRREAGLRRKLELAFTDYAKYLREKYEKEKV